MPKFHGDFKELHAAVSASGVAGDWRDESGGKHMFRGKRGEVLNWWPSKGTLLFQGKNKEEFETRLETVLAEGTGYTQSSSPEDAKIFLVHGHDREARDQLELILMRLGLQPFILQNSDGAGQTIIESLEKNIYHEAAYGIVLLTPDDFGYSKAAGETEKQPRARQNVILEMGMIMAALGRERMAILKKGAIEMPSDAAGILYIEFNDHAREIVPKLAQSLQGAGFNIDPKKIAAASA